MKLDLDATLAQARAMDAAWVFGYASLLWRPEFEAMEVRPARALGWHRALKMRSRLNRGTEACPGLVFALLTGGACRGMAYRLNPKTLALDLARLWAREMPLDTYEPRWLRCVTPQGPVQALSFTLPRTHPSYTGTMADADLLRVLQHAEGRYGTTLHYVQETQRALQAAGIQDPAINRLMALFDRQCGAA